jgi:hypothetical protein
MSGERSTITIVSVSFRSTGYLKHLLSNLHAKASNPDRMSALIIDNTNDRDAELARLSDAPFTVLIARFNPQETNASRAHAKALDFALQRIDTEYALVVDPDVHVFYRGWDELCTGELNRHQAIAIGAPYPDWKVGKYHDFPSPPFCFFRTAALRQLGTGWAPFGATPAHDRRTLVVRQVGRLGNLLTRRRFERSELLRRYAASAERHLGLFGPDTGWRYAHAARQLGLRSILFSPVRAGAEPIEACRGSSSSHAFSTLASEYELYVTSEDRLMLTHKYGSGAWPWRTKRGDDADLWRECITRLESELS